MSSSRLHGLISLARPRQWAKNLLVAGAPLAAGTLLQLPTLAWTFAAFVFFSMAATSVYMLNDVVDAESDRRHPIKRARPVASGAVSPVLALVCAFALGVASMLLPIVLGNARLALVLAGYLILHLLYSAWLKHEPVLDLAAVASGFLLRAIAGGVAAEVPISQAFLIVVGFGAFFLVVGKRYSELVTHDQTNGSTRRSLKQYTPSYLRFMLGVAGSVTLVGYVLWAFEIDKADVIPFAAISVIPFTLAMLRYGKDIDAAVAEAPEQLLTRDPVLLILGAVWFGLFVGHLVQ